MVSVEISHRGGVVLSLLCVIGIPPCSFGPDIIARLEQAFKMQIAMQVCKQPKCSTCPQQYGTLFMASIMTVTSDFIKTCSRS